MKSAVEYVAKDVSRVCGLTAEHLSKRRLKALTVADKDKAINTLREAEHVIIDLLEELAACRLRLKTN